MTRRLGVLMHHKHLPHCNRRAVVLAMLGFVTELSGCGGGLADESTPGAPGVGGTDNAGLSSGGTGGFDSTGPSAGGGTDTAGLSSGGTGSFTSGTITGFGSIIVNGIRYDDSKASIVSDDGLVTDQSMLQIGVDVVIEGSDMSPAASPAELPFATAIRTESPMAVSGSVR